ncbi:MAG: hypothetical protein K6G55_05725 [Selenomonadaceae bacterium]|nr:hypothetical protein [Selenomonadaceae bacterium]
MFEKFICAAFIAAVIFGGNVTASAEDFYICTENNRECYIVTESIVNQTVYSNNREFSAEVKFVNDNRVEKLTYKFRENDGIIYFNIDGGADNWMQRGTTEEKIWQYCLEYLGIDYVVRYD